MNYIYFKRVYNNNYTLCSSAIDLVKYSNNKNTCKLQCNLRNKFKFPIYPNDSCFRKKLYEKKNGIYYSLYNLSVNFYTYESKYQYSAIIVVYVSLNTLEERNYLC